jgi:hypothetical protein
MWPFTRKTDASNVDGLAAPTPPQIRFEWKAVPPIQRVIADHPLTVPTESFATDLATHQDPRAVAEPLGHQVSLEAPRGLVLGIAQPQTRADGPEMVTRPRPARRFPLQRSLDEPADATAPIETADIEAPLVTGGGPVGATMRQLPVSSGAPLQRASLTTVGPESEPLPLAPTRDIVLAGNLPAGESETIEPAALLPALPRLTLGQTRRLGLGAPLSRLPDTSLQRAAEHAAPPPSVGSPTTATPVAEELPYDPIFPLDFPTPKPVVAPAPISRPQRIPTAMPLARPSLSSDAPPSSEAAAEAIGTPPPQPAVEPTVVAPLLGSQAIAVSGDPPHTMLDEPATGEREGTDEAALPPLPLAGTSARTASPGESTATSDFASEAPADAPPTGNASSSITQSNGWATPMAGEATIAPLLSERPLVTSSVQRAPENGSGPPIAGEATTVAPLLSERPLVTTAVQRAPEGVPSSISGLSAPAVPGGLGGIRVYRGNEASTKASAIGARAFTERGDIYLPAAHGPLNDMPARSLLAHELVHAGQQRRFGGGLPAEHSDDGQRMEAEAETVERSVATDAEMPLARVAASPVQASTAVIEARAPWATSSTIQRALESNGGSPSASEAPSMSSAGQPAPAASVSPQKVDDTQMDELAGKLYDKIRSRLRNELLVDRERAGFLTDLR